MWCRADLSRANLYRAKLRGVVTDLATKCPKGFDPVAAGVIFE